VKTTLGWSLWHIAKTALQVAGSLAFITSVARHPLVRRVRDHLPGFAASSPTGWDTPHPFDLEHGIDAHGFVPTKDLDSGVPGVTASQGYGASQPSILRAALATLPRLETCTFLDLGCGKGRPLVVASEFPFRDILGVELSPTLASIAQTNADTIARRYPTRTRVRIAVADATTHPIPAGDVALFLYNPFSFELTSLIATRVEAALATEHRRIYVVYYNPVFGTVFDASPALTRRFASMLPYAPEELGHGPDAEDAVVMWQGGNAPPPIARADARIVVTIPGTRAEIGA